MSWLLMLQVARIAMASLATASATKDTGVATRIKVWWMANNSVLRDATASLVALVFILIRATDIAMYTQSLELKEVRVPRLTQSVKLDSLRRWATDSGAGSLGLGAGSQEGQTTRSIKVNSSSGVIANRGAQQAIAAVQTRRWQLAFPRQRASAMPMLVALPSLCAPWGVQDSSCSAIASALKTTRKKVHPGAFT